MYLILVNPNSGAGQGRLLLEYLQQQVSSGILKADLLELKFPELDQQLLEHQRYAAVFVAGGDGTVATVLSKLAGTNTPVGVLALGTGNDLARTLYSKPKLNFQEITTLLTQPLNLNPKLFQLWQISFGQNFEQHKIFSNYFSFGFDAAVVQSFDSWRRNLQQNSHSFAVLRNRIAYAWFSLVKLRTRLNWQGLQIFKDGHQVILPQDKFRSLIFSNIKPVMGLGITNLFSDPYDQQIEAQLTSCVWHYLSMITYHRLSLPQPKALGAGESWLIKGLPSGVLLQVDGEFVEVGESRDFRVELGGKVRVLSS